jgi:hypothetical protein
MSAYGTKRTSEADGSMSAIGGKADMANLGVHALNKPVARRSRDGSFRMRSSGHHAAASALPTAQTFNELGNRSARFESETDELPIRNKATVLTG